MKCCLENDLPCDNFEREHRALSDPPGSEPICKSARAFRGAPEPSQRIRKLREGRIATRSSSVPMGNLWKCRGKPDRPGHAPAEKTFLLQFVFISNRLLKSRPARVPPNFDVFHGSSKRIQRAIWTRGPKGSRCNRLSFREGGSKSHVVTACLRSESHVVPACGFRKGISV